MALLNLLFLLLKLFSHAVTQQLPDNCPELNFGKIPATHLFNRKEKPVIIAHRGQPKIYQENTKDGILSTLDIKADGFELDIYKTKDNKLVVFHDDNTKRMTGVSKVVYNSTYTELLELNLTTKIIAGENTYRFNKSRKIPLLEDILIETSKHDIIHYLEMKPSDPFRPHEAELATETGNLVANMIEKMNLVDKAIVVSFDFRKVAAVKKRNPNITVGTLFTQKYKNITKGRYEAAAEPLGNFSQCLKNAPTDQLGFFQFILNTGLLFKASGSSSFDCDIKLYNNPSYSNNTMETLRQNYGNGISTGFYTVYSMSKTEEQNREDEKKLEVLQRGGGGQRMITDDVARLRKLLGRTDDENSAVTPNNMNHFMLALILVFTMMF